MDRMELRIHNRREDMPAIITMVEEFGVKNNIPGAVVNDLNLALDEVLINILSHGYADGATGQILVQLNYQSGELSAEIRDDGKPFDPLQVGPPDLGGTVQTRNVGGLGVHFVRQLMDNVVYARVGNENRLLLIKKIRG
jgi:anti-sigma regulatory factor (Ser/Thr protein kinase)